MGLVKHAPVVTLATSPGRKVVQLPRGAEFQPVPAAPEAQISSWHASGA